MEKELANAFRSQQQKYVYYIIGLSITAIGFIVHKTIGVKLTYSLIPVGISTLSWMICIYTGLRFLNNSISALYSNHELVVIQKGKNPEIQENKDLINTAVKTIVNTINGLSSKNEKNLKIMQYSFYIGILSFVAWHIYGMYVLC